MNRKHHAFTLVELLVVIGIIALLISILLPALNRARRAAMTVQCASNMRQIAMGMLTYIQDNKGVFPAATVFPNTIYPNGWWWPNELVRLKYVGQDGANVYRQAGQPTSSKQFDRSSVFRCPEGREEEDGGGGAGDWPTHASNNRFQLFFDTQAAADGFGVPSWYQLNCRNDSATNAWVADPTYIGGAINNSGDRNSPFMGWQSNTGGQPIRIKSPAFQRNMGMVKKAADLVMMIEAADQNWWDQTASTQYPTLVFLRRMGARHGKAHGPDGIYAYSNFAFFDGHVALYDVEPFVKTQNAILTTANPVFNMRRQR